MVFIIKKSKATVWYFLVKEINSKERDQFWLKEEQEEKKRVEAEKKRREEVCI